MRGEKTSINRNWCEPICYQRPGFQFFIFFYGGGVNFHRFLRKGFRFLYNHFVWFTRKKKVLCVTLDSGLEMRMRLFFWRFFFLFFSVDLFFLTFRCEYFYLSSVDTRYKFCTEHGWFHFKWFIWLSFLVEVPLLNHRKLWNFFYYYFYDFES